MPRYRKRPSAPITRAKLHPRKRDYYRAQVNCDKRYIAVLYNYIADSNSQEAEGLRNAYSVPIVAFIAQHFRFKVEKPGEWDRFHEWLEAHTKGEPGLFTELANWAKTI